jgi:hypothetical protein
MIVDRLWRLPRCCALALVLAGCVDGAAGHEDPTDSPAVGQPPTVAASITVRVLGTIDNPAPVAGAQISVNASDGSVITSGASDSSGSFTVANPPTGASITVQAQDARFSFVTGFLQTYYDVAPGSTYIFRFARPVAPPTQIATIHATVSNAPTDTFITVDAGPDCRGSGTTDVAIFPSCVQSDGKVTVYATAMRSDRTLVGAALLRDVAFTPGGTTNVALDTWPTPPAGQQLSFGSAPGPILDPNSVFGGSAISYSFYRRGIVYTPEVSTPGKTSGNAFTTQSYLFPIELPLGEPGKGFLVGFSSGFETSAGSQYGGFVSRVNALPSFAEYDLHQALPVLDLTAFLDIRNFARPAVTWSSSAGTFDGAFLVGSWQNLGDDSATLWLAKSPVGRNAMTLPTLPLSIAASAPRPGARFGAFLLSMMDASWVSGYNAFTDQDSVDVLGGMIDVPAGTEGALKYAIAVPATALQFSATATPAAGALAELAALRTR